MSISALEKAIGDRAAGDIGTGGLFKVGAQLITGIYNTQPPARQGAVDPGENYPYVVFNIADFSQEDGFSVDIASAVIRFNLYYPRDKIPASGSALGACNAILARLYGDAVTQSDRVPTYGFHRWTPTLSGTLWVPSAMMRVSATSLHSEDMYQFVEEYRLYMSNKGS